MNGFGLLVIQMQREDASAVLDPSGKLWTFICFADGADFPRRLSLLRTHVQTGLTCTMLGPVPKHTRRIVFVESLSFGCVPGHVIYPPSNSNGGSVSEQTFSSLHC